MCSRDESFMDCLTASSPYLIPLLIIAIGVGLLLHYTSPWRALAKQAAALDAKIQARNNEFKRRGLH